MRQGAGIIVLIVVLLCMSCSKDNPTSENLSSDTSLISDISLEQIEILRVNDSKAVSRIMRLNPPHFGEEVDEIDKLNGLRLWLRKNTNHGPGAFKHSFYPPEMISRMRNDKDYSATCGPFSVAYAGLLLAHDIPVRLVHVYKKSRDGMLRSHTFNEVWSEQDQKWIVQDVDLNISWMDEHGKPVTALDIQRSVFEDGANVFPCRHRKKILQKNIIDRKLFHRLVISYQANYFKVGTIPYLQYQVGSMVHLLRSGEEEKNDPSWLNYKQRLSLQTSTDPKLIYAPVNQIAVTRENAGRKCIFTMRNNILNFDHYEILKGADGWKKISGIGFSVSKDKLIKNHGISVRGVSGRGHITKAVDINLE